MTLYWFLFAVTDSCSVEFSHLRQVKVVDMNCLFSYVSYMLRS